MSSPGDEYCAYVKALREYGYDSDEAFAAWETWARLVGFDVNDEAARRNNTPQAMVA